MSLRLNRSNGKKTCMFSARELAIAWVDDPSYWRWTSLPESRFAEVVELLSVCWLDIRATLKSQVLTPNTKYAAYLLFKLSEDHFGLQEPSVASLTEGEATNTTTVYIAPPTYPGEFYVASRRPDGWLEVELGEFFVEEGDGCDVGIQLCETEKGNWKSGLIVEGIEVRPKEPIRNNNNNNNNNSKLLLLPLLFLFLFLFLFYIM